MKKNLFIACVLLNVFVFGQSADKSEVERLSHDVKILKAESTKLKNELRDSITSLTESLGDLKKLYLIANKVIKTDESSLDLTTSSLAQLNEYTHIKFNRYRGIIRTSVMWGLSVIIVFGIALVMLFLKVRKNANQIEENFRLQTTSLDTSVHKILQRMNTDNELLDLKINELSKRFINQITDAKNSNENQINKTKEQLKKDITYSSQLGFSQLLEVKKETNEHFALLNERINIFEKILKDKLSDKE